MSGGIKRVCSLSYGEIPHIRSLPDNQAGIVGTSVGSLQSGASAH